MRRIHRAQCESIESRRLLSGGVRDMSFGTAGVVTAAALSNTTLLRMDQLPDGRILVDGEVYVARLTIDGQLDPTFGVNGLSSSRIGSRGYAPMAVGRDGSYYLCGTESPDFASFWAARYTSDGERDLAFGGGAGLVTMKSGLPRFNPYLMHVLADGSLLLGGNSGGLWRITPEGAISNFSAQFDGGGTRDVIELPDGDLLISYQEPVGNAYKPALVRLNADGSVDGSFAHFIMTDDAAQPGAQRIELQSDGRIIMACAWAFHACLVAIEPNGQRDTSWGNNGVIVYDFAPIMEQVDDVVVHADDSITLAVTAVKNSGYQNDVSDALLVHLNAEGERDVLFGVNGVTRYSGGKGDKALSLLQQADGGLLLLSQPALLMGGELTAYSAPVGASPISVSTGGRLQVIGTSGADEVTISESGTQYIVSINCLQAGVSRALVSSCLVATVGGNDQVTLNMRSDLPFTINGGGGNDALHVSNSNSAGVSLLEPQIGEGMLTSGSGARSVNHVGVESVDAGSPAPFLAAAALELETRVALTLTFNTDIGSSLSASDLVLRDTVSGSVWPIADQAITLNQTSTGATVVSIALPYTLQSAHWRLDLAVGAVSSVAGIASDFEHRVRFDYSPGDTNGNGLTDFADLVVIAQHFGQNVQGRSQGDVNYDGKVNFDDLLTIAQCYNLPTPLPATQAVPYRSRRTSERGQGIEMST